MSNCMYTAQGDFVCNEDTIEHFRPSPTITGTYTQSCNNCSFSNNFLDCYCKKKNKKVVTARLNVDRCQRNNNTIYVGNNDGKLFC
jgi:hypothetical protein